MPRSPGRSAALVPLLVATLCLGMPGVARAQGYLQGIDVSRWQGQISWGQVAGAGIRFVFAKATDGRDLADPYFTQNRSGAIGAGIRFGAYHYARPDGSAGDAVAEARFFTSVAQISAGNLPPVLDFEEDGGLGPEALTNWVLDFLAEVRRITGVRALVYTSPNGWKARVADTTRVADAGYDLWLAHWTEETPLLPANNWGGRGWEVWQYSDCGRIAGISTCVDLDRFNGTNLNAITIRELDVDVQGGEGTVTSEPAGIACGSECTRLFDAGTQVTLVAEAPVGSYLGGWGGACGGAGECTVTMSANRAVTANFVSDPVAPTVTVEPPKGPDGQIVARFDEIVLGVSDASIVLRKKGGAAVPASVVCRAGGGAIVDCEGTNVKSASVQAQTPLEEGGTYVLAMNEKTPRITDRARNPLAKTLATFLVPIPVSVEESDAAVTQSWKPVKAAAAVGGSYVVERAKGASASFRCTGQKIEWLTLAGPTMGVAQVKIDGKAKGTYDLAAGSLQKRVVKFSGLPAGDHTITIVATGKTGAGGGGSYVAVDGFKVGAQTFATPELVTRWRTATSSLASGGRWVQSNVAGSIVAFTFSGSSIAWTAAVGPDQGKVKVLVDGKVIGTFDDYAANPGTLARVVQGLAAGSHTIKIVVLGTANAASSGTWVTVDGFTPR
ncbi:MAG: glycoside hydrolase family 25 protein [Actinomycetota bacterium]